MNDRAGGVLDAVAAGGLLIEAERRPQGSAGVHVHHDPTTGAAQAEVPLAGEAEVDEAVRAARAALPAWRALPADERAGILFRLADLLEAEREAAARLWALEAGMPVSLLEPGAYTARWVRYYAGWVDKLEGRVVPTYPGAGLDYTLPEPYGVIGVIPPWNGSMMGMGQKAAPALAAGNAVVAKPPELAPFGAYRFAELALAAGLPPGVLNVVAGGAVAGRALVRHPDVDKVSFTGGTATASAVMAAAAATCTPLALELGGKSANLVFADADLDRAVPLSAFGFAALTGQGCALPTRLLVQEAVYDEVVDRVVGTLRHVPVGDPLDPAVFVGPLVTAAARDRVQGVIDQAAATGAGRLLAGGGRPEGVPDGGYFLAPTVFGDVDPASPLAQDEVFGPVLAVTRFRDDDEAVALANGTRYGLGATVHTRDLERAHRLARRLEAGSVTVNGSPGGLCPTVPFGGVKASGFGREGGREGIDEFLRTKNVYVQL